ncbi:response regulator [Paraflavitalea speifideaquila]|uniref:response regulator n=1 Tax=Paraflavitalea speifideaquila TaxID=3076558 RepID=UPI0028ECBC7D|nr:response regulator [Paraflavitalea speifideiaquila]
MQTVLGKDYTVVTAPDGCSAMYWLSKRNLPDLIITDAQLPDMQDWELIEQLTSSGIYRDIPLMVISALDKAQADAKCQEFGVAENFTKPFNPVDLMNAVQRIINNDTKVASAYVAHAS